MEAGQGARGGASGTSFRMNASFKMPQAAAAPEPQVRGRRSGRGRKGAEGKIEEGGRTRGDESAGSLSGTIIGPWAASGCTNSPNRQRVLLAAPQGPAGDQRVQAAYQHRMLSFSPCLTQPFPSPALPAALQGHHGAHASPRPMERQPATHCQLLLLCSSGQGVRSAQLNVCTVPLKSGMPTQPGEGESVAVR